VYFVSAEHNIPDKGPPQKHREWTPAQLHDGLCRLARACPSRHEAWGQDCRCDRKDRSIAAESLLGHRCGSTSRSVSEGRAASCREHRVGRAAGGR
jgi:hypothetical protein